MKYQLTALEARVIGCLLEKQVTTPEQHLVGQGPCALPGSDGRATARVAPTEGYKRCGEVRNPPVTASPCQPPLGKGAKGTDCHNQ